MKFNRIRVDRVLPTAIAIAIVGAAEVSAQSVNLSGAWTFTVTIETGVSYPEVEVLLEQDGESLVGRYSSDQLGQSAVLGSVRGREMTISFSTEFEGQFYLVVYNGTVDKEGEITGTLDIGAGLVLGTFVAARSEH